MLVQNRFGVELFIANIATENFGMELGDVKRQQLAKFENFTCRKGGGENTIQVTDESAMMIRQISLQRIARGTTH